MTTTTITSAAIGAQLERTARALAPVIAAVYTAGLSTGIWLHQLNDTLAAAYVAVLGLQPPAPAPVEQPQQQPQQQPTPAPSAPAPLPTTVKALRAEARERGIPSRQWKSARKAELQLLLAC